MTDNRALQSRLKSCLQTILDLEPMLDSLECKRGMETELETLKAFMHRAGHMDLDEHSVRRIEEATNCFLEEMRVPVSQVAIKHHNARLLQ